VLRFTTFVSGRQVEVRKKAEERVLKTINETSVGEPTGGQSRKRYLIFTKNWRPSLTKHCCEGGRGHSECRWSSLAVDRRVQEQVGSVRSGFGIRARLLYEAAHLAKHCRGAMRFMSSRSCSRGALLTRGSATLLAAYNPGEFTRNKRSRPALVRISFIDPWEYESERMKVCAGRRIPLRTRRRSGTVHLQPRLAFRDD